MNAARSMNATITHFATCFPDWNSLDSVRRAHSRLEGIALVSFALLVLFEVLSHLSEDKDRARWFEKIGLCFFALAVLAEIAAYPYGERNDTLSENIIGSLDAKAREASTNASSALTKAEAADTIAGRAQGKAEAAEASANRTGALATQAESDAQSAQQDAAQLRADVDETELLFAAKASGHTLWPSLLKTLKSMPPASVRISCVSQADPETKEFARRLSAVLKDFNWQVSPGSVGITSVGKGVVIRNRWVSAPVHTGPRTGLDFVEVELDSSWMRQELEYASKDIGHENALRLSALALALRARLEKSSDLLDQNSLFIIIGVGDSK
jgi:hypothetical protein